MHAHPSTAYLPEGPDTQDDEDEASIFWSLVVPEERVPEELTARGTQAEKLRFCCDMVRDWDPSLYVPTMKLEQACC